MAEEQKVRTLTIDGTEYPITDFSEQVQRLVAIHAEWEIGAVRQRIELAKSEAALRDIVREIEAVVKKELDEKNAPANDDEVVVEAA